MKLLAWISGVPWGLVAYLSVCVIAGGVAVYFRQWRLLLWAVIAAVVGVTWQRIGAWHDAYERLPETEARLAAETACTLASECHKRAATLAEQARLEAEERAQNALQVAQEREAKARADAQAWRKRYEAALRDDPDCAEWAAASVRCPL